MPFLGNRQHFPRRHAAQLIVRHIVQQRAQQDIRHRLRNRHHVQQPLIGNHIRERGPALESTEDRALGRVVDGVLFDFGTMRGIPRVIGINIAVEDVGEDALIGRQQPALQRTGIGVRSQPFRGGSRRAAADAIRIDNAHVRVEPLLAVMVKGPQAVEEGLHGRHLIALTRLHLRL